MLLGTGEGAIYWLRDEATEGPVKLGFPRTLFEPRSKVDKDDRSYTGRVGGRLKLAMIDWDGDGLQDLLVGDSQAQRGYNAKSSLSKKKQERFGELNDAYLKLADSFDEACEERTFWGRGWRDKAKADEAQARVSACFDEMEPLTDELEQLSSKQEREGEPEGVVWIMLRKEQR